MNDRYSRRDFVAVAAAAGVGFAIQGTGAASLAAEKPTILGGPKTRAASWPSWPIKDTLDEEAIDEVLRSGRWFRGGGNQVNRFEEAYARLFGAKYCVAVASGTGALVNSFSMRVSTGPTAISGFLRGRQCRLPVPPCRAQQPQLGLTAEIPCGSAAVGPFRCWMPTGRTAPGRLLA